MLEKIWYGNRLLAFPLLPLSALFGLVSGLRRVLYGTGLKKVHRFPAPVIVVGNLAVGGTGKTPLVIWLCEHLRSRGFRPGIVSRGYGGSASHWPQQVRADSDPVVVGDEAVLLARRTGCPMCVSPDRPAAVEALLQHSNCDIVVSDDGLQHLAMGRDLEIVVVDGRRGLGNGFLLPAGPLREPPGRLRKADLVISSATRWEDVPVMHIVKPRLVPLVESSVRPRPLASFSGQRVHAVAGIGNPQRFFDLLTDHGMEVIPHVFPDHHAFRRMDLWFEPDLPVVMTEKDAVKCRRYGKRNHWVVQIDVQPEQAFIDGLDRLLKELKIGQEAARHSGVPPVQGEADLQEGSAGTHLQG